MLCLELCGLCVPVQVSACSCLAWFIYSCCPCQIIGHQFNGSSGLLTVFVPFFPFFSVMVCASFQNLTLPHPPAARHPHFWLSRSCADGSPVAAVFSFVAQLCCMPILSGWVSGKCSFFYRVRHVLPSLPSFLCAGSGLADCLCPTLGSGRCGNRLFLSAFVVGPLCGSGFTFIVVVCCSALAFGSFLCCAVHFVLLISVLLDVRFWGCLIFAFSRFSPLAGFSLVFLFSFPGFGACRSTRFV